jgi:hypothetical protein
VGQSQSSRPWHAHPQQEISGTASRWSAPRAWRRALEQALVAVLVPGATPVTLAIVNDLAKRMDYSTGHVAYDLEGIAARCGVTTSTVKRHLAALRRAGWIAWAEHGSLRNALRRLAPIPRGYAKTATVYAATIPAAYDRAAGNVVVGTGYEAQLRTPGPGLTPVDNASPVDNQASNQDAKRSSAPPSLEVVREDCYPQVEVEGKATATRERPVSPKKSILGQDVPGWAFQTATRIAKWVRPLLTWAQRASVGQLSWVLVDLVIKGWTEEDIRSWCYQVGRTESDGQWWRPNKPHLYLAAQLLTDASREATERKRAGADQEALLEENLDRPGVYGDAPNPEFVSVVRGLERQIERSADVRQQRLDEAMANVRTITPQEREAFRRDAAADLSLVRASFAHLGVPATVYLYGQRLLDAALREPVSV